MGRRLPGRSLSPEWVVFEQFSADFDTFTTRQMGRRLPGQSLSPEWVVFEELSADFDTFFSPDGRNAGC